MKLWKLFQIWCLKWLLAKHRHYNTISSAGPRDGGIYDTYWIRLIRFKDQEKRRQQLRGYELGEPEAAPEELYRLNVVLGDDGKLKHQEFKAESKDPDKPLVDLKPDFLAKHFIEIRHFYRDAEFESASPVWTASKRFFRLHWLIYWCKQVNIWYQSRKFTVIDDYIDVLQALIRASDKARPREGISRFQVAEMLYGKHLDKVNLAVHFQAARSCEQVLEFLADIGQVSKVRDGYRPNAHTLNAVHERVKEREAEARERLHNQFQFALTGILAVSSSIMASVELFRVGWWPFN